MSSPSEISQQNTVPAIQTDRTTGPESSHASQGTAGDGLNFLSLLNQQTPASDASTKTELPATQAEVEQLLKMLGALPNNVDIPISQVVAALIR